MNASPVVNDRYNNYIAIMPQDPPPPKPAHLEEQVFVALMRAADHAQRRVAEMLKGHDLSPTQYNALRILRGAGPDGLPCSEIATRMINHDPDITRLMTRLEKRGWVQRSRPKQDRRVVNARITERGLALLKGVDPEVDSFQRNLFGHMGDRRLTSFLRLLEVAIADREQT
jgi:DNA-binding MarR family transcriptional regulator